MLVRVAELPTGEKKQTPRHGPQFKTKFIVFTLMVENLYFGHLNPGLQVM